MKEAMEEVKSELGRDAVILHTKKYREGGFLGYHSKDVVEVTAAIEDAPERGQKRAPKAVEEAPPKPRTGERPLPVFPANILNQYKTNGTQAGVDMVSPPLDMPSFEPHPAYQEVDSRKEAGAAPELAPPLEPLPEPVPAPKAEEEIKAIEQEEKAAEIICSSQSRKIQRKYRNWKQSFPR
jgi:flagellar biosynthesis protein FlhF